MGEREHMRKTFGFHPPTNYGVKLAEPAPAAKCEAVRRADGEWVCDRCESLWTDMLNDTGFRPRECLNPKN